MRKFFLFSLIFTGLSLGLLGVLFWLDCSDIPSKCRLMSGVNMREWLGYATNALGAMIGAGLAAMSAFGAGWVEQEKERQRQGEMSRKSVLPLIKVKYDNSILKRKAEEPLFGNLIELAQDDEEPLFINLEFTNVGFREMYDIWVGGINYGEGESGHYCNIAAVIHKNDFFSGTLNGAIKEKYKKKGMRIFLNVYYSDCYGNWYRQRLSGESKEKMYIAYFVAMCAPERISAKELPEDIIERKSIKAGK